VSNIGVAMFAVAYQDAALAFYTEQLGFKLRSDTRFGEHARPGAIGGIDLDPEPMRNPGTPLMFMLRDPRQPHRRGRTAAGRGNHTHSHSRPRRHANPRPDRRLQSPTRRGAEDATGETKRQEMTQRDCLTSRSDR